MSGMILAAFQLGFVYALLPGPILIASSQYVVTGGWQRGCWFILGVTLADLIYIAVTHWGFRSLWMENGLVSLCLWILGGAWLIKLGLDAMRAKPDADPTGRPVSSVRDFRRTLADGLFINLLNPLTLLGWIGLGANFIGLWGQAMPEDNSLPVLLTILSGILTWQLLVVAFISVVRQQIHGRVLKSLSLVGGICLIGYGLSAWVSAARTIL
jgi:threonine/homoserine/homoserine lactone efflux protein